MNMKFFNSKEELLDNIVFKLVNAERDKDFLSSVPHRFFMDFAVVYRSIKVIDGNLSSAGIDNNFSGKLNLSESDLFNHAVKNTWKLLKPEVKSMNEVINEIIGFGFASNEDILKNDVPIWVITNAYSYLGANAFLFENVFFNLSDTLGADLYIFPSSINDLIVVPATSDMEGKEEYMKQIVWEVNGTESVGDLYLSDNVYYYSKKLRSITIIGG